VPALVRLIGWMGCPPFRTHKEETMISRRYPSALFAVAAVILLTATTGSAQLTPFFDHLKCYAIKDFLHVKPFKADLIPEQVAAGFQVEPGCKIIMPAKLFCIDVRKTNVQPPPPFVVNGTSNARDYLCYKIACPKQQPLPQLVIRDQFGRRDVFIKPPKFLCAPAEKENQPTPQPTSTPTPTQTPPIPTETRTPNPTTTRTPDGCDFDAATGKCAGVCPPTTTGQPQQCVFLVNSDGTVDCDCRPPDPACTLPAAGGNQCVGPCPDPRDQCVTISVAGAPATCDCTHPCQPDPTSPPTCSGDCQNPNEVCVANAAAGCDCRPPTAPPCGNATAPQCDGHCPQGEMCVQGSPSGCFCETGTPPPCGTGGPFGPPQCYGVCPPNLACVVAGTNCTCQ
jgi:hypothetical protein